MFQSWCEVTFWGLEISLCGIQVKCTTINIKSIILERASERMAWEKILDSSYLFRVSCCLQFTTLKHFFDFHFPSFFSEASLNPFCLPSFYIPRRLCKNKQASLLILWAGRQEEGEGSVRMKLYVGGFSLGNENTQHPFTTNFFNQLPAAINNWITTTFASISSCYSMICHVLWICVYISS